MQLYDLWQKIISDHMKLWNLMTENNWYIFQEFSEDLHWSQESETFYDDQTAESLTDLLNWISLEIQL